MLSRTQYQQIYKDVYTTISNLKRDTISPEELGIIIRRSYKRYGIRSDKAKIMYIVGYFKRNKVLIPDGNLLKFHEK